MNMVEMLHELEVGTTDKVIEGKEVTDVVQQHGCGTTPRMISVLRTKRPSKHRQTRNHVA